MKLTPEETRELVIDYIYGELEGERLALFEEALREDAGLREEVESLSSLRRRINQDLHEELTLDAGLKKRISRASRRRAAEAETMPVFEYVQRFLFNPAFATAVVALIVVSVVFYISGDRDIGILKQEKQIKTAVETETAKQAPNAQEIPETTAAAAETGKRPEESTKDESGKMKPALEAKSAPDDKKTQGPAPARYKDEEKAGGTKEPPKKTIISEPAAIGLLKGASSLSEIGGGGAAGGETTGKMMPAPKEDKGAAVDSLEYEEKEQKKMKKSGVPAQEFRQVETLPASSKPAEEQDEDADILEKARALKKKGFYKDSLDAYQKIIENPEGRDLDKILVEACETALLAGNKKLAREMSEKVDKKLIDGKKAEKTLERCLDAAESK